MSDDDVLYPEDLNLKANKKQEASSDNFGTYNLDEIEKTLIKKVMSRQGGNISKAAKDLGLTRTSLYRRLEKYGL